jgi:3-deoxy-D-manno-octulosonate 8-phosphate phosphatase (KDO 8-P phosphatase)
MDSNLTKMRGINENSIKEKVANIKLLLTDVDGVLTDNGVYYSAAGEEMKRFSIRDGMGVERLRKVCKIDTGIITGENSPSVSRRAEKLKIEELHLGIKDKLSCLKEIVERRGLLLSEVAYIGDDVNDLEVMQHVGLSACPKDALPIVIEAVDFVCEIKGGDGAFREFAEFLIASQESALKKKLTDINRIQN